MKQSFSHYHLLTAETFALSNPFPVVSPEKSTHPSTSALCNSEFDRKYEQ
jgi:hypothetical protein